MKAHRRSRKSPEPPTGRGEALAEQVFGFSFFFSQTSGLGPGTGYHTGGPLSPAPWAGQGGQVLGSSQGQGEGCYRRSGGPAPPRDAVPEADLLEVCKAAGRISQSSRLRPQLASAVPVLKSCSVGSLLPTLLSPCLEDHIPPGPQPALAATCQLALQTLFLCYFPVHMTSFILNSDRSCLCD